MQKKKGNLKAKTKNSKSDAVKKLKSEIEHLKEASHSKDEFIRITNHELRTPLDVIRGNLDMILKGDTGEISKQTREYLEDVILGADRLTKLVNAMLDLSQAESGRMKFSLEEIDTEAFLKNIDAEFMPIAKEKGIALYLNIEAGLPHIISDRAKLYQILDNLLGNAMKFTPKGGSITIKGSKNGDTVRFAVQDTGIGIRSDDVPKLFKRFPDIDTSVIGAPKGNGMGLALIFQIALRLQGHIRVESAGLGKGSTFLFEFPTVNTALASKLLKTYPKAK